jgi:hypothetical protein
MVRNSFPEATNEREPDRHARQIFLRAKLVRLKILYIRTVMGLGWLAGGLPKLIDEANSISEVGCQHAAS